MIWRRRGEYFEKTLCSRDTVKEIRTLGVFRYFMDKYVHAVKTVAQKLQSAARRQLGIDLLLCSLTVLGYMGILLLLVREMLAGHISVGSFAAVFGGVTTMYMYAREVFVGILRNITRNAFAVRNYQRFLEYEPPGTGQGRGEIVHHPAKQASPDASSDSGAEPEDGPEPPHRSDFGIRIILEHVSFAYPNQEKNALEDISLTLSQGESIALVGENGAGKTTLARLILGLYPPGAGRIIYDLPGEGDRMQEDGDGTQNNAEQKGAEKKKADPLRFLRCSAVFQNFQKYPMTLKENVVISDWKRGAEEYRIPHICSSVGLSIGSDSFPDGLETLLAVPFGGVDLSGGQWQRVAMSRGLFREHEIIVLDEPTAAIDPMEETALYKTFARISRGKLSVIVTHRLGAAKIADRILVLKDGKLLDMGSHDALMRQCNYYRELYEAQSKWYK